MVISPTCRSAVLSTPTPALNLAATDLSPMEIEVLAEVTIPLFKNTYQSSKVRPKYYKTTDNIPKAISAQVGRVQNGYLLDKLGKKICKNAAKIGKIPEKPINGQNLYNGTMHFMVRSQLMKDLKASFLPYIKQLPVIKEFPVQIFYEFHCEWGSRDLSNIALIFVKALEDTMVAAKVIPDDQTKFIDGYFPRAFKAPNDQRKIVIKIVKIFT